MQRSSLLSITLLTGLFALVCACSPSARPPTAKPPVQTPASPTLNPTLFLTAAPDHAHTLVEMKADAKAGDEVAFIARIGGRAEPFAKSAAVFLVVDPKLPPCNELKGDACKTPWDYCCETPDDLVAHSATVRIVGADLQPLPIALQGTHGLEPLRTVTIRGKVAERDESGSLFIVDASGIYVNP